MKPNQLNTDKQPIEFKPEFNSRIPNCDDIEKTDHFKNVKRFSDSELLASTERLTKVEATTTIAILHHLKEIDDRKLYADKNCDSLFTYCVRILRYSESQAHRRITAARLIKQIPNLDSRIQDGRLTLTNIAQAQNFFLFEKRAGRILTNERKLDILSRLEDKTTREAERVLISEYPNDRPIKRESMRFITENAIEMKLILGPELLQKLTRVKVLCSHRLPEASWSDIVDYLCDDALERIDPMNRAKRAIDRQSRLICGDNKERVKLKKNSNRHFASFGDQSEMSNSATTDLARRPENKPENTHSNLPINMKPRREAVPAATRHQIWLRDGGKCSHIDPATKNICGSSLRIEIDHIHPVALGGGNEISNLRLLCRAHNQRRVTSAGIIPKSQNSASKPNQPP